MKLATILLVVGIAVTVGAQTANAQSYPRASGRVRLGPLHFVSSVGHEIKQTGIDFITFRHPAWNLIAFAEIAADIADAKTTADCQHMPNCMEANTFLYGRKPDFHKVLLIDIGSSWTLITMDHYLHTHRPEPYIKTSDYWWIAPGALDIASTSRAAYMNTQVKLTK
jgi:hypothetical protein